MFLFFTNKTKCVVCLEIRSEIYLLVGLKNTGISFLSTVVNNQADWWYETSELCIDTVSNPSNELIF